MARYCITPIVGTGDLPNEDPYRAAILGVADGAVRAIIPADNVGDPLWRFTVCRFDATNMAAVAAVPSTYILPDFPLDALLESMDPDTRVAMVQSVQAYDISKDLSGVHISLIAFGNSDRYRDVVEHIAHTFEPVQWLDVPNA